VLESHTCGLADACTVRIDICKHVRIPAAAAESCTRCPLHATAPIAHGHSHLQRTWGEWVCTGHTCAMPMMSLTMWGVRDTVPGRGHRTCAHCTSLQQTQEPQSPMQFTIRRIQKRPSALWSRGSTIVTSNGCFASTSSRAATKPQKEPPTTSTFMTATVTV
jgi:hypothetical protein